MSTSTAGFDNPIFVGDNNEQRSINPDSSFVAPKDPPRRRSTVSGSSTDLAQNAWFHGRTTREQAEDILRENGGGEGLFLVRESISSPGDYALSVVHKGAVTHYQIRRHGQDAFFSIVENGPVAHGLEELISLYSKGGLCTELTHNCPGKPPPPESLRHGRTNLLHRATEQNNVSLVTELLESNYQSDAKNEEGQTSLHLACMHGLSAVANVLLDMRAPVNCLDGKGLTPLHYACRLGNCDRVVTALLQAGADPHIRALALGYVPLHEAAYNGHLETIKILLAHGAALRPRTNQNETPLDLAAAASKTECQEFLKSYVAQLSPNFPGREKWYHGELSRECANEVLLREGAHSDGAYLVRQSSRMPGVYVLSLCINSKDVKHYELQRCAGYFYLDNGPYFDSLECLIDHYTRFDDGLPTRLLTPVSRLVSPVIPPRTWKSSLSAPPSSSPCGVQSRPSPPSPFDPAYVITINSLILGDVIGEGEFGSVRRATWCGPGGSRIQVAVKVLREDHQPEGFVQEVENMMGLHHPCIVRLMGVCQGPPLMMVQELIPLGSLLDYLAQHSEEIVVNMDIPRWAAQIASGMAFLEEHNFVHRDLAARNILLASKFQAKISDFGLSRTLGNRDYYRATTGGKWPLKWYAPESVLYGTFSHRSDVWSYGVTLWEMYSLGLAMPYGSLTGAQVVELLEQGERLKQPEQCPDWAYDAMLRCWSLDPDDRPRFAELHRLFSQNTQTGTTGVATSTNSSIKTTTAPATGIV